MGGAGDAQAGAGAAAAAKEAFALASWTGDGARRATALILSVTKSHGLELPGRQDGPNPQPLAIRSA